MRTAARFFSALALVATVLPACLFYAGKLDLPQVKTGMLVATVLWFLTAPFWMERRGGASERRA